LSGVEILDQLIFVAEEVEARTTIDDLAQWWYPFDGHFRDFMYKTIVKHGLNERPADDYHQPLSSYAQQHHRTKADTNSILPSMRILDKDRLSSLPDEAEVMGVSFNIWYSLHNSKKFFDPAAPESYIRDGASPKMASFRAAIFNARQRWCGRRNINEVSQEILDLLLPHRVNPEDTTVHVFVDLPCDIFAYKSRYFILQHTPVPKPDGRPGKDVKSNGAWPIILSSYAIYHLESGNAPFAYTIFKDDKRALPAARSVNILMPGK
jgi:hypothetical protein